MQLLIEETEVVFVFLFIFGSDIFLVFLEKYKTVFQNLLYYVSGLF